MAGTWTTTSDSTTTNTTHANADDALESGRRLAQAGVTTVKVTAPDGSSFSRK